jgi:hypothetical protein
VALKVRRHFHTVNLTSKWACKTSKSIQNAGSFSLFMVYLAVCSFYPYRAKIASSRVEFRRYRSSLLCFCEAEKGSPVLPGMSASIQCRCKPKRSVRGKTRQHTPFVLNPTTPRSHLSPPNTRFAAVDLFASHGTHSCRRGKRAFLSGRLLSGCPGSAGGQLSEGQTAFGALGIMKCEECTSKKTPLFRCLRQPYKRRCYAHLPWLSRLLNP